MHFLIKFSEEILIIIQHWIRILSIKLGWIHDFDKLVAKYVRFFYFSFADKQIFIDFIIYYHYLTQATVFIIDSFCSTSKLLKTFIGHSSYVWSIDYSKLDYGQFICSGSDDGTVRVWDTKNNKHIKLFGGHSNQFYCVKFSTYYNHHRNVICSSSYDKTIRFWDIKDNQQQICNGHTDCIGGIEFSPFNGGRYLCSGSFDKTIRLWDIEEFKSLKFSMVMKIAFGVWIFHHCKVITKMIIKVIILVLLVAMDILFALDHGIQPFVYGILKQPSNPLYSKDMIIIVRLWDIRSGQQIQAFNGHTDDVNAVEYSPFVVANIDVGCSNVICSGSRDNTIRFWDIRTNKNKLYLINGDKKEDCGILCLKFLQLNKKKNAIMIMIIVLIYVMDEQKVYRTYIVMKLDKTRPKQKYNNIKQNILFLIGNSIEVLPFWTLVLIQYVLKEAIKCSRI
ncbi:WD-40 repeat protein [Reticulomyxa filosa]|uniref:WD-40 repeat protein n=1 Tax=Reticulomyxa filosa TaxID=46433 RepID=X6M1D4_RETFI|nr:WD-40 repeat protein [Reticulomyxa filosa]|eukprot:ETO06800.1 WD-40 repeat protein [Reticulomyxa filosa]